MNAPSSSRRGLWLAFGGLAIVPFVGVTLMLTMGGEREDRDEEHDRPSPAVAEDDSTEGPETFARAEPSPAPEPVLDNPDLEQDPSAQGPDLDDGVEVETGGSGPGDDLDGLLEQSRKVEKTDPVQARQLLRDVLAVDPDNVAALERLSTKMLIDERHAEAKHLAKHCEELGGPEACQQVATLSFENSPAVEHLAGAAKGCLAETPDNLGCLSGMVNYHLIKGEVSDAAVYAGRLTQQAPQSPHTLYARARIKAASKEYTEARQLFRWACDQGSQDACFRVDALEAEGW